MVTEKCIKEAFEYSVHKESGNLRQLALKTKVPYTVIHNLHNGKTGFLRMTVGTLTKLFPDMRIYFCRENYPSGEHSVSVNGTNLGQIASGDMNVAIHAQSKGDLPQLPDCSPKLINKDWLEEQILRAEDFNNDERIKFLLFLKDKTK